MSDEELLEKSQGGDPEAFAELYNRYFPSLVRYASTILPSLAADIAQETFVKVLIARAGFIPSKGTAKSWLFQIAHNLAIDAQRKDKRMVPLPEITTRDTDAGSLLANTPNPQPTAEDIAIAREHRNAVRECLGQLPEELRLVVHLVYLEDLKFREVAEILNVPIGTVASRSLKARGLLRHCLKTKRVEL